MQKKKVLIVDDEQALLRILGIKLRVSGYDVLTAGNGKEALDLISSSQPDLIILDIIMPEMDGFELLEKLRAFPKIPVIACSARPENGWRTLSLGATCFLAKPFDVEELVLRIQALLRNGFHCD